MAFSTVTLFTEFDQFSKGSFLYYLNPPMFPLPPFLAVLFDRKDTTCFADPLPIALSLYVNFLDFPNRINGLGPYNRSLGGCHQSSDLCKDIIHTAQDRPCLKSFPGFRPLLNTMNVFLFHEPEN